MPSSIGFVVVVGGSIMLTTPFRSLKKFFATGILTSPKTWVGFFGSVFLNRLPKSGWDAGIDFRQEIPQSAR